MNSLCKDCFVYRSTHIETHSYERWIVLNLHSVLDNEHENCLIKWIEAGSDVNSQLSVLGQTPLMCSAKNNWFGAIGHLVAAGATVNQVDIEGKTSLLYAVQNKCEESVKKLLECGADVTIGASCYFFHMTPLKSAAFYGYQRILKILLDAGAPVDESERGGTTALILATFKNNNKCIKELVKAGANVNLSTDYGCTALSITHQYTSAMILIESGADPNIKDDFGFTPVLSACNVGNSKLLQVLIDAGASVNVRDPNGDTPIITAAMQGSTKCVEILIKHSCDLNLTGTFSNTALVESARYGHLKCVLLLLHASAMINVSCANTVSAKVTPKNEQTVLVLFAAGQKLCDTDSSEAPHIIRYAEKDKNLKHLCRKAICQHFMKIKPNSHLFGQLPRLGLPSTLTAYLLYNISW